MSTVRVVYHHAPPVFPATEQHPDAKRYGPYTIDGGIYYADAVGGKPTEAEIRSVVGLSAGP